MIALRMLFAVTLVGWAASPSAASRWDERKAERVDALMAPYHAFVKPRALPSPAVSVAVGVDGQLVFAKGYGEARDGVPATADTVYHIGSITKQLTAAAVLRLIEDKKTVPLSAKAVGLETAVRHCIDGVDHWAITGRRPVTVGMLLSMTSNLGNFTRRPPESADPWGMIDAAQLLTEIKKLSPHGLPDTFEYSNTSYFLLAEIIEALNGRGPGGYRDHLRKAVFERVGMTRTGFIGDYPAGSTVARPAHRRRPAFMERDWLKGSADVASTVVDVFAWNKALMEGRVLGREMRDTMFSDAARVGPYEWYGMGWFVEHRPGFDRYYHSGQIPGFTAYNLIKKYPGRQSWVSVTVLASSDGVADLDQLAETLAELAIE